MLDTVEKVVYILTMQLTPVGSNQTEVIINGNTVLFSYRTPVAVFIPGRGALATIKKYSTTTTRHINNAIHRWGATRIDVPQFEIDCTIEGGGRFVG